MLETTTQTTPLIVIALAALFVVFIVVLVISMVALSKANKALELSEQSRLEKLIEDSVPRYLGFKGRKLLKEAVREELNNERHDSFVSKNESVTVHKQNPSAQGVLENTQIVEPIKETQSGPVSEGISLPTPIMLYTGSYSTGSFRHITTDPDDKTIFTICAKDKDAEEGVLNIDPNAYGKVLQTPDYLKNACSCSGNGSIIHIVQMGRVIKSKGVWTVADPVIVEFN